MGTTCSNRRPTNVKLGLSCTEAIIRARQKPITFSTNKKCSKRHSFSFAATLLDTFLSNTLQIGILVRSPCLSLQWRGFHLLTLWQLRQVHACKMATKQQKCRRYLQKYYHLELWKSDFRNFRHSPDGNPTTGSRHIVSSPKQLLSKAKQPGKEEHTRNWLACILNNLERCLCACVGACEEKASRWDTYEPLCDTMAVRNGVSPTWLHDDNVAPELLSASIPNKAHNNWLVGLKHPYTSSTPSTFTPANKAKILPPKKRENKPLPWIVFKFLMKKAWHGGMFMHLGTRPANAILTAVCFWLSDLTFFPQRILKAWKWSFHWWVALPRAEPVHANSYTSW